MNCDVLLLGYDNRNVKDSNLGLVLPSCGKPVTMTLINDMSLELNVLKPGMGQAWRCSVACQG